jgi:betaine-homocysteine S-methyltransferase
MREIGNLMADNISNTNIWELENPEKQTELRSIFVEIVG